MSLEKRIEKLEKDIEEYNKKVSAHIDFHVIEDLRKAEKDPSTTHCVPFRHTKYIYKYSIEEISKRWDVSIEHVLELAEKNNIDRKGE